MYSHPLIDNPAYTSTARKGFAGHTFPPSVLTALDAESAKRLLRKFMSNTSKDEHFALAASHAAAAEKADSAWIKLVKDQFLAVFGRPYGPTDYKVSGIARDEFPDSVKSKLRDLRDGANAHTTLSIAHLMASGLCLQRSRDAFHELKKAI